jgi:serine/threonine protein kinase
MSMYTQELPLNITDMYTHRRICENQYEFPTDRTVSGNARQLVSQILTQDPQQRPTLHDILDHGFFTQGIVPSYIPMTAHTRAGLQAYLAAAK